MNKIEKAVLQTLTFYDILERPLILDELWHYLYRLKASKLQVFMGLKKLIEKGQVAEKDFYYFLNGREKIAEDYSLKQEISRKRFIKSDRIIKILRFMPFIKNISVINSLSYNNSRQDSDIDILIIAKKDRLWTARALTILLLEIIGQNKNKWYKAGKFCLGFAFDETRLDLSKIKYRNDIDFTYFLANLTPVFDRGIYRELIEANSWINKELPNWEKKNYSIENSKLRIFEKLLLGKMGDKLEKWLAKIQINRIWRDPKNKRKGASVIADESMMKLHPYDKRIERQKEWERKIGKLI